MATDILLINPPYRMVPPFTYDRYEQIDPPRNLAILAAWLEASGVSVEILDAPVLEMSFDDIAQMIRQRRPRIIGITNRSTSTFPMVQRVASIAKAVSPEAPVIVGGTYVSWMPEEALSNCRDIDYLVIGEGDIQTPELVTRLLDGRSVHDIAGLAYRDPSSPQHIKRTPPARVVEDLDQIPFPAYHLVPIEKYVGRGERYILSLTRGCIFHCEYCTSSFERGRVRSHSVAKVMSELRWAYEKGFRYFYFFDDILTVDRERIVELCDAIIGSGLSFPWHCLTRSEYVDEALLHKMKAAGCDRIAYGVESASASSLASFRRRVKKTREAFALTRMAGIRSIAFAVFGFPGETFADQIATIRWLRELNPGMVRDFTYKPYPGTPQYANPEKFGIQISDRNFVRWSQQDEPVHRTEHLSEEEIIEVRVLCSYIFRSQGQLQGGVRYRRKKKVVMVRVENGALIYNHYKADEERRVDLYLNCLRVSALYFEVMLHCDGYHNVPAITEIIAKLFNLDRDGAYRKVRHVVEHASQHGMLEEMPALAPALPDGVDATPPDGTEAAVRLPAEDRILSAPGLG
ncbi:B12-binding domain-containing radical SAM protein [Azospirillum thermophilum]|nr:radical SAM protein [Azospirillum thermophilum]